MKNETKRHLMLSVIVAIFWGLVGSMIVDDEQKDHAHYCAMVADGLWPDYRKGDITCE
jgi:hypothetical protein